MTQADVGRDAAPEEPREERNLLSGLRFLLLSLIPIVGIAYSLHLPEWLLDKVLWREQVGLAMLGLALAAVYVAAGKTRPARLACRLLALAGLGICLFLAANYEDYAAGGYGSYGPDGTVKLVTSIVVLCLLVDAVRRVSGIALSIIMLVFLGYTLVAGSLPGLLNGRTPELDVLFTYLVLDQSGILGAPLSVVITTVFAYVLLGVALFHYGGGQMFIDLALACMGGYRGAPAKVAIMASSLFGTVSGSAVANVMTTGIITIPMMKKSGFSPTRAGAVEAVASTGGQILPPIMGAAAFIMAEMLQVSYATIAIAALIPAVLYYVSVFAQVHFYAARHGMKALPPEERPKVARTLKIYWPFLVPLAALIYVLFFTVQQAETAALLASALVVVAAIAHRRAAPKMVDILSVLHETGKALLDVVIVTAVAGVLIGALSITGLSFSFGFKMLQFAGNSEFLLLLVTAAAALVLGMGMPTAAVYILLAALAAPSLVQSGIEPIAAHLFVLYFGVFSMITPPVCLAAFAGASLAKAGYMRTGFEAMRLGAVAFIMPFLFVNAPSLLLLNPDWVTTALQLATALAGCVILASAAEGYFLSVLSWPLRLLGLAGGLSLLLPDGPNVDAFWSGYSDLLGLVLCGTYVTLGLIAQARSRFPLQTEH